MSENRINGQDELPDMTVGRIPVTSDTAPAGVSNLWIHGNPTREELRAYQVFGNPATRVDGGTNR